MATAVGALERVWGSPATAAGWLGAVNHKAVGMRFIVLAFVFLLAGGVEALLIRLQLAGPGGTVLGPDAYNQVFTMHGTTMMFLFAVPMLEGLGSYFVPLMLGTRDMPFPRANALGFWCFLFGGVFLHASFLTGSAPDGGWFAYTPLTRLEFSPGLNLDYWLLGVTFVEIAGLLFAVEMIALVMKQKAPGMSLNRLPLFAWSMLTTAFIMLFAFPPLLVASIFLELDRKVGTHFFNPDAGGDPVLWQHLFWFFGHPDVYILFLPAAGVISTIVPVFVRSRIAGYAFLVAATLLVGFLSFGVWTHHMFATGLPVLTISFFAAASLLFALPNGMQFFAWLETIRRGRQVVWQTPMLFVVGFLVIFLAGGITGVMVAVIPFDWQVHDSFFVVAHFHYVLVGGVVFPFFAGLHFWWPKLTGRMAGERLGKTAFWLMFVGFNVGFFVQHILGFLGMPRRIYTFQSGLGWDTHNLISTVGAFVLGLGVAVFAANLVWSWFRGERAPGDPWGAGTLDWATASPPAPYNFREIPLVASRDPLWDDPQPASQLEHERWTLPLTEPREGRREVVTTSEVAAEPDGISYLPQQSLAPFVTAVGIGVMLAGVLVDAYGVLLAGLVVAAVAVGAWLWPTTATADGSGERVRGRSTPFWGALLTVAILGTTLASIAASYLYLRSGEGAWPPPGFDEPDVGLALVATALIVASGGAVAWAFRATAAGRRRGLLGGLAAAVVLGVAFLVVLSLELARVDFGPADHAYGSLVFVTAGFPGVVALVGVACLAAALVRAVQGRFSAGRAVPLTVVSLLWAFAVFAWIVSAAVLYGTPYVW